MSIPELVTIHTSLLTDLGDAVRAKTGGSEEMTLDEMATAVEGIPKNTEIVFHNNNVRNLYINDTDSLRMTNFPIYADRSGNTVYFNTTDLTKFRFVTKFRPTALPSVNAWPCFYGAFARTTPRVLLLNSGQVSCEWKIGSTTYSCSSHATVTLNKWHYCSLSFDSAADSKLKLALYDENGQLLGSGESDVISAMPSAANYDLQIAGAGSASDITLANCYVDYGESFFEKNGEVFFGNQSAISKELGKQSAT